jgi:hypothetical protein
MAQQNIDFGTFPDDPSADAIRTAFNKVQNNFDQLFGANANTTVTSINRTPGAGVTVNYPTGNVVLSANLACLQVSTSSLKMGRGSNTGSNALITQSSQTLVIDVNPAYVYSNYFADVNNGLSIFNGNLSINSNYQANLTSFGNLTSLNVDGRANFTGSNTYIASVSNLHIPGGGAGYTIVTDGAGNLSWSAVTAGNGTPGGNATEIQFQGSGGNLGLFSGNAGFTFTTANGLLQTPLLTVAGNAIAANFTGTLANGNSNITITGNSNITVTANSNITMLITDTGANITGTANISGNANVGNIGAEQGIFTTSANIPLIQNGNSNVTIGQDTTVSIFVAGNATPTISATSTGANISGIANVSSDIVSGGNISTTGSNGTVQANNFNITGAATGNSNVSTVTGNLGIRAIASTYTDNVVVGGATIANAAIHAIDQPTLAAANAVVTFTNASTLYIANAPAPGTNATLTNPWALTIANGNTYLGGAYNYIAGNLTVAGTTTYYNVTSFAVQDPIISLGGGANGNALTTNDGKDRGTALQYYTTAPVTAFMGWDNSNSEFAFGSNVSITSEVVTFTNLGNARGLTWLGNIDGTYANFTGNIYTTGNANLGNTATANYFTGTLTTANQPNINNVGTLLNTVLGSANSLTGGNLVSATYLTGTLTTAAQPNITSVNTSFSNLTFASNGNITMSGNASQLSGANLVSANFLIGTGITASGAASGNANIATITGNLGIRALAATYTDTQPTIATGNAAIHVIAQPTITGGTNAKAYTNLSTFYIANSPANSTNATFTSSYALFVNAGNSYFGGLISAGANVTAPIFTSNIAIGTAPFTVTSTTRVANLSVAYANVSDFGVVTTQNTGTYYPVFVNGSTSANYALGSNTLISANLANGALIATTFVGNITGNIGGILANGNSNVSIPASNGNVNITAVGNTTFVVTGTGANITGTANISGNANVNNLGTTRILASGNITTTQLISNIAQGTAPFVVTSTTQVANLNVATAGTATSATTAGTVTTNAQPNINSVGTLSALTVSGNIDSTGNIKANAIIGDAFGGNLSITGRVGISGDYNSGGIIDIAGGGGNASGYTYGGYVQLRGGNGLGGGGAATLAGGDAYGTGAQVLARGGISTGAGSGNGTGGNLEMNGGNSVGTDFPGGITFIRGGTGTGAGVPGNIAIQVSTALATGTTAQTVSNVIVVTGTGANITGTANISGNANVNNLGTTRILASGNITTTQLISNIAVGTAPLTVTSTTRVANLNVAYANVSDFGAVTAQTTGTYYPVMVSAGTTGNYAHAVGPTGISHNLATNTVTATTFTGNLSGNVTATGTVQAANITATAFITRAVTTSISANGTGPTGNTQANATALTTEINIVSAVSATTGVRLPAAVAGTVVYITNNSANSLVVYPQTNGQINNLGANIGFTQGANATLQFMAPTTTQWYTIGATYA